MDVKKIYHFLVLQKIKIIKIIFLIIVKNVIRKMEYTGNYTYNILFEFCKNGDLCTFIENYDK